MINDISEEFLNSPLKKILINNETNERQKNHTKIIKTNFTNKISNEPIKLNITKNLKVSEIFSQDLNKEKSQSIRIRIKWTEAEDKKLIKIKQDFPYLSWFQISQFFSNRNKNECMNRYRLVIQPGIKKGKWSKEEDKILFDWVNKNGPNYWGKLSSQNLIMGRTSKQIRDRWINSLHPTFNKIKWDLKNEKILLEKYLIYGSSWTKISKFIENSSENIIKNRFYSMLRKTTNKYLNSFGVKQKIENFDDNSEEKYKNWFDNFDFEKIHNKNKNKIKIIEKDLIETYLKFDVNQENESIFVNNKTKDTNVENNLEISENFLINKRKKKNFSLDKLLKFLPILLSEKNIEYKKYFDTSHNNIIEYENNQLLNMEISNNVKLKTQINIKKLENNYKKIKKIKNTNKNNLKSDIKINRIKENSINKNLLNENLDISSKEKIFDNNNSIFTDYTYKFKKEILHNLNKNTNDLNKIDYINNINSYNDVIMNNSYNSFNNISNSNNYLKNFFITNNINNNDSFISNENEINELNLFSNNFLSNQINLNLFPESNNLNKNSNNNFNSMNFSDILDMENNINYLNNSNNSFNTTNMQNNLNLSNSANLDIGTNLYNGNKSCGLKRFKSSILLNLQLNLLNKIVEKIRINFVQKFFSEFKTNTLTRKKDNFTNNIIEKNENKNNLINYK